MHARIGALLVAACLAFASGAAAQEQRGSIEGTVRDSSGAVLPGATVEARNVTQGGVATTVSDASGVFRFPALAPGRYNLEATLQGFAAAKLENVELLLGQIKTVDLTLGVSGVAETVQVTAESPLVDVRQSARAVSIREEQVELLPKGRDFTSLVTQAPGANNEQRLGGLSIDGASAGENRYIIDGVETTDIKEGTSGKQVLPDFIEEVQVKSSGYTAEFGGATGGVVNVITKSGTNEMHGMGLLYFEGSALSGGRYALSSGTSVGDFNGGTATAAPQAAGGRPSLRLNPVTNAAEYFEYPEDDNTRLEPGFSIGGPIATDKAWFYAAYQPTLMRWERTAQVSNGQSVTREQKDTRHFFTANSTSQVGQNLRTRAAVNNSFRKRDGMLPALDGTDLPNTPYDLIRSYPNWSVSGSADWVARPNLYIGVRTGYYFSDIKDENFPTGPRTTWGTGNIGFVGTNGVAVPPQFQQGANFSSFPAGAATSYVRDQQKRWQFQTDATWYAQLAGQHQFKGGVQFDQIGNDVDLGEAGNRVTVRWGSQLPTGSPLTRGPFGYYSVRSNGVDPKRGFITEGDVSTTNVGLFFQDAWTIGSRFTVNAGVRTERERVPAYAAGPDIPTYGIEFDFKDKLAPRLGFAWDLKGDGRQKLYSSWGIFYDIFKLELPRGSFGGDKWLEYYYTLDTPDWPSLTSSASCPPACSGTLIRGPIDFRHPSFGSDAIEPDLKPMKMQEAVVGFEQQLTQVTAASVRYVHKQIDRAIEDTGALDAQGNEIYVIANPGEGLTEFAWTSPRVNLPKPKRDYDAVEFAFDKRYADNWFARVSYMWSRLEGNYSGLSQGDENGRTSPNVGRLFDYPAMMFDEHGQPVFGPLPTDRPHQFKVQGIYSLPFGTSVGANFQIQSGVPVSREIGILPTSNFPVNYRGRGSDGRTDVFSQTDMYVQHEFKVGGDRAVQLSLNIINLFDQSASIGKWQTYQLVNTNGISFDETDFYSGRLNFDQLIQEQHVQQDPRFLQDAWYQFPISARFGVKFLF